MVSPDTLDRAPSPEASPVSPAVVASGKHDSKARKSRAKGRKQARRWRVSYQRPTSVVWAAFGLAGLSVAALLLSPFVAIQEQSFGFLPFMKSSIVRPMIALGLLFLPFGVMIGQARNWSRWALMLIGAGLIGYGAYLSYPKTEIWLAGPLIVWLLFLALLFNPQANRFFR